jgi:flagellin
VWAISKTMESDVAGFEAISTASRLARETVAVARKAAEAVTEYLQQMKGEIVTPGPELQPRRRPEAHRRAQGIDRLGGGRGPA